jgi:hypothetical protein
LNFIGHFPDLQTGSAQNAAPHAFDAGRPLQ